MKEMVEFLAKDGYWLLFAAVLGRQACLPVPADLLLIAAGALAGMGRLSFTAIIAFSVVAFLLADLTWYTAGRRWGRRTLNFICGVSRDPDACLNKIDKTFARYGVKQLLVCKFLIGLDTVVIPMSGVSRISLPRFLVFDAFGAILWSSVHAGLGYIFSNQLDRVAEYAARMGKLIGFAVLTWFGLLMVRTLVRWYRFLREFRLARITPDELRERLAAGDKILVLDLQGGTKQFDGLYAIPGAVRIDPSELNRYVRQYRGTDLPTDREVILYCDRPSEITSARVALALQGLGFEHVRPLAGGIQAWRERGFPVTSTVEMLPLAEHGVFVLCELLRYSRHHTAQVLKTSAENVDRLLKRALQRIGSTRNAHLLSSNSHGPSAGAESMPSVPATLRARQRNTPE